MKTYRLGIVGLGRMGSTIDDEVRDYPAVPRPYAVAACCAGMGEKLDPEAPGSARYELVCGADVEAPKRDAFEERWGVKALYDDYLEMIAREAPDIVAVCTKGPLHAEMGVAVAEAGVRMVYMEKAMACSMAEADAVLKACTEHDTVFNTGVLRRFNPRYAVVREAILRGDIGEPNAAVHYARTNLLHGHIHSIDTLSFLLGDPKITRVRGTLRPQETTFVNDRIEKDPDSVYELVFENGVEAWTVPAGPWEFEVIGTEGTIRSTNNGTGVDLRVAKKEARRASWEPADFDLPAPRSATLGCLDDLVDAYEEGRPALNNAALAHHTTEACFAVAESHAAGGMWVDLPGVRRDRYIYHV